MNLPKTLDDIPELKQANVHVRNEPELLTKIKKVIEGGHGKLQIVTDFDHTLTRHTLDNGTSVLTSFGMFRECPSLPQSYKDENEKLSLVYRPIESDPIMSVEEKTKHIIEWYEATGQLLKGLKFPRTELMDVAQNMEQSFRRGVKELIEWSRARQVPVLVFSAGLGECVRAALCAAGLLQPHVKVVSNFLAMDPDDNIVGMEGDVIHTYNKNETAIKNTDYYDLVRERSNVLLMGDNIGDAAMAEGMEHCDVVVKLGFLGHHVDANLQNYLDKFDIVAVNEPTMDIINAIVKLVL